MIEIKKFGEDGQVVRTEYTTINTDTGVTVHHKCNTYLLKDEGEDVVFQKWKREIDPIKWEKVSEV